MIEKIDIKKMKQEEPDDLIRIVNYIGTSIDKINEVIDYINGKESNEHLKATQQTISEEIRKILSKDSSFGRY